MTVYTDVELKQMKDELWGRLEKVIQSFVEPEVWQRDLQSMACQIPWTCLKLVVVLTKDQEAHWWNTLVLTLSCERRMFWSVVGQTADIEQNVPMALYCSGIMKKTHPNRLRWLKGYALKKPEKPSHKNMLWNSGLFRGKKGFCNFLQSSKAGLRTFIWHSDLFSLPSPKIRSTKTWIYYQSTPKRKELSKTHMHDRWPVGKKMWWYRQERRVGYDTLTHMSVGRHQRCKEETLTFAVLIKK